MKKITISFVVPLIYLFLIPKPVAATEIYTGFSPSGGAQEIVLNAIKDARQSIQVAAYSFTSKPISIALVRAKQRGLTVSVIADKEWNESNNYTSVNYLANNGVPVRLNGQYKIMHNKFMIIDGKSVQTGSFNYTKAADKDNSENVIYLRDAPGTAEDYAVEFNRLWSEGQDLKPRF